MRIDAQLVEKEVVRWKRLLGLRDWKIEVKYRADSDDDYANVDSSPGYKRAAIRVNLDNVTSYKQLRSTVIHELIHVVLSLYTDVATELAGEDARKALDMLEERVVTEIENWPLWKEIRDVK